MRESWIQKKRFIRRFYNDVVKRALFFYVLTFILILVVEILRMHVLAYVLGFIICFGISFFLHFMSREVLPEFEKGDI